MIKPTTQGQRIKLARKAKGLTQTALAEKVGIKGHTVIVNYEKDTRGREHPNLALLVKIAEVTEVSIDWLLTGKEDKNKSGSKDTVNNYPSIQNFAPIISWDEVSTWKLLRKNMNLAHREQVPLFDGEGDNCFGLRVMDDSMVTSNIDEDSFRKGDTIVIDSERKPEVDDYVVAQLDENEPTIFRKLTKNNEGLTLEPLNSAYPSNTITEKVIFFGVVVGQHRSFRKK